MDNTQQIIDQYYQSLKAGNDNWKDMWSSDGVFSDASQSLHAEGKEAVIASFTPFLKGVSNVSVVERIIQENKCCYVIDYTYVNKNQDSLQQKVAEVWQTEGGKLKVLTIYFDLTAFGSFMEV